MLIAALFTTVKIWNQYNSQSSDQWIKKMYIYTTEDYSALKKKEILLFATMK
jgi:hypothetical protein